MIEGTVSTIIHTSITNPLLYSHQLLVHTICEDLFGPTPLALHAEALLCQGADDLQQQDHRAARVQQC